MKVLTIAFVAALLGSGLTTSSPWDELCAPPRSVFQQYQDCVFEDSPVGLNRNTEEMFSCMGVDSFMGIINIICAQVDAGEEPDVLELYDQWTRCQSTVGDYFMSETEQAQYRAALLKCHPLIENHVPEGFMKPEF